MTKDHILARIGELLDIMDQLRGPGGCPWDAKQTPETLKPYLIEETYEVLEAIDNGEPAAICEELGDLFLQIVFHAAIFSERGAFSMGDVAQGITAKLRRRHPHVFAAATCADEAELHRQWERIKRLEKGPTDERFTILSGIPAALPPAQRVLKIIDRSTRAGLQWPGRNACAPRATDQLDAVTEGDFQMRSPADREELFGDLLLTLHLLAKQLEVDPERALQRSLNLLTQRLASSEACAVPTKVETGSLAQIDMTEVLWPHLPPLDPREKP
ncbi:MAG: hypothetical protein A2091_02480 [Desulfuromonadales bacterium GWD2_61_12]|nr:MAG: hypothetical protein A2091_02480 [Desulfuromonadales bacterium GWD2_61_12]HBT83929.1 nucleoside triphosphate pyrophosphohydrolase [Desulfuromonas sp.]